MRIFPLLSALQVTLLTKIANGNTAKTFKKIHISFFKDSYPGTSALEQFYMEGVI